MNDLINRSATEVVRLLRDGDITPLEALDALEAHVESTDGTVNALPIRFFDYARNAARRYMESHPKPTDRGWLAGLPVAVKDYNDVAGQITSHGSPIFADTRAETSDAMVSMLERHGAIPYAKSNVPELAGGHTYNTVWGATRNPWDLRRTAGGSSGGAAAALASGSAWLATGNDLGGSLRTPSGYNGTVAVRPTPGRVPRRRPATPFDPLWVEGPMARNVEDVALMLDAMTGYDRHDPLTSEPPARPFAGIDELGTRLRIAYSPDLGQVPVERDVRRVTSDAMKHFEAMGADVTDDCPDFAGAYDAFQSLRAHLVATLHGHLLDEHRERIKEDIIWNIERGLGQPLSTLQSAERTRGELVHRVAGFFEHHDALVCPSAPLNPFPVDWTHPHDIAGIASRTYIDWISITFIVTLTGCPVVAMPCGFSEEGIPVGIQIIGAPRSEARLLAIAAQFEQTVGVGAQLPIAPRPAGTES